jgi:hypothetical protein
MPIRRFTGTSAWAVLSESERAEFGALGLELIVGIKAMQATEDPERPDEPTESPSNRAAHAAVAKIVVLMDEALRGLSPALADMFDDHPPVPSLVGDVCETCGCTEEDACEGGCAWQRPGLCTTCAPGRMNYAPPEIRKVRGLQS